MRLHELKPPSRKAYSCQKGGPGHWFRSWEDRRPGAERAKGTLRWGVRRGFERWPNALFQRLPKRGFSIKNSARNGLQ